VWLQLIQKLNFVDGFVLLPFEQYKSWEVGDAKLPAELVLLFAVYYARDDFLSGLL